MFTVSSLRRISENDPSLVSLDLGSSVLSQTRLQCKEQEFTETESIWQTGEALGQALATALNP